MFSSEYQQILQILMSFKQVVRNITLKRRLKLSNYNQKLEQEQENQYILKKCGEQENKVIMR